MRNKYYKILDYTWAIIAILIFIASIKFLSDGTLGEKVVTMGLWAPLVIFLLKISTLVFAPLGGTPLYVVSGAVYGNLYGFLICFAGDVVGSALCFFISKRWGMRAVKFFAGNSNINKIEKMLSILHNTKSFIKARVAFFTIPELLAYAAGLTRMNFWKFMLLQIPLYIPSGFVLVFLGSTIAVFTTRYAIFLSLFAIILASLGIWTLAKDYRKIEGL